MVHTDPDTDRIQDPSERYIWVIFNTTVFISSLLGDSLILLATIKYRAITMPPIAVVIIQHLAVSDLFLTLFRVLPSIVSLIKDDWVFGTGLCYLNDHIHWLCNPLVMVLTCALVVAKYLTVKYPFRAETWTKKQGHVLCSIFWIIGLINPIHIIRAAFSKSGSLHFCFKDYSCSYKIDLEHIGVHARAFSFTSGLLYSLPVLLMIILFSTCALLLIHAKRSAMRHRQQLRWQGVLAVVMTSGVFLLSVGPFYAIKVARINDNVKLERAVEFLQNSHIMANFFVYCLTVKSFRLFLKERISRVIQMMTSSGPSSSISCTTIATNCGPEFSQSASRPSSAHVRDYPGVEMSSFRTSWISNQSCSITVL